MDTIDTKGEEAVHLVKEWGVGSSGVRAVLRVRNTGALSFRHSPRGMVREGLAWHLGQGTNTFSDGSAYSAIRKNDKLPQTP